jgi:hypothetical protein
VHSLNRNHHHHHHHHYHQCLFRVTSRVPSHLSTSSQHSSLLAYLDGEYNLPQFGSALTRLLSRLPLSPTDPRLKISRSFSHGMRKLHLRFLSLRPSIQTLRRYWRLRQKLRSSRGRLTGRRLMLTLIHSQLPLEWVKVSGWHRSLE